MKLFLSTIRRFNLQRFLLLWCLFALLFLAAGCTLAWTTEVSNLLPLLASAAAAIVGVLGALGKKVSPTTLTAFSKWEKDSQSALATIEDLVTQYKSAAATAQPGLISEIETAANTVAGELTQILPELQITDPATQEVVTAAVDAFNGAMQSVLNLIPVLKGTVTPLMAGAITDAGEIKKRIAAAPSAKEFQHKFNTDMDAISAVAPEVPKGKFHIKGKSNISKIGGAVKKL